MAGAPASGGSAGEGGISGSGSAPGAGGAMGGAGNADTCDPAFDCIGARSYWLQYAAWGRSLSTQPRVVRCVDYHADSWIDFWDYLDLSEDWGEGCRSNGPQVPAGSCLFPGDMNGSGCLDFEDYEAIESELGGLASSASPCADVNDDGYVDELDLAHFLETLAAVSCPDLVLDPHEQVGMDAGEAHTCGSKTPADINNDSEVDSSDLRGVLSHFGLEVSSGAECFDINRDNSVDLSDALHVLYLSSSTATELACPDILNELSNYVSSNRSCSQDSDCAAFDAGCSHIADDCDRLVYLNGSTDADALEELVDDSAACLSLSGCRRCGGAAPHSPRCITGSCQPGAN